MPNRRFSFERAALTSFQCRSARLPTSRLLCEETIAENIVDLEICRVDFRQRDDRSRCRKITVARSHSVPSNCSNASGETDVAFVHLLADLRRLSRAIVIKDAIQRGLGDFLAGRLSRDVGDAGSAAALRQHVLAVEANRNGHWFTFSPSS